MRFAGLGSGLLFATFAAAVWWIRRSELSLYRVLGLSNRELLTMASVETLLVMWAPFSLGAVVAVCSRINDFGPMTVATLPSDLGLAVPILVLTPWLNVILIELAKPVRVLREV